jgi:putative peptide zinc metalloprotease protein
MRPDGEEWVVGRVDTGEFVALPDAGRRVIELLGAGLPVEGVARHLRDEGAGDVDVTEVMALLRNLVIGVLSRAGPVNLAALRRHARDHTRPLTTSA